jgi:hypothetical protein
MNRAPYFVNFMPFVVSSLLRQRMALDSARAIKPKYGPTRFQPREASDDHQLCRLSKWAKARRHRRE